MVDHQTDTPARDIPHIPKRTLFDVAQASNPPACGSLRCGTEIVFVILRPLQGRTTFSANSVSGGIAPLNHRLMAATPAGVGWGCERNIKDSNSGVSPVHGQYERRSSSGSATCRTTCGWSGRWRRGRRGRWTWSAESSWGRPSRNSARCRNLGCPLLPSAHRFALGPACDPLDEH